MTRKWSHGAMVVILVVIGGCGDTDDGDATAVPDVDSTIERSCIEQAIEAYNGLDVSGLDPSDGFDDQERSVMESRMEILLDATPSLAADGECTRELENQSEGEIGAFVDNLRPEVAAALGAASYEPFSITGHATEPRLTDEAKDAARMCSTLQVALATKYGEGTLDNALHDEMDQACALAAEKLAIEAPIGNPAASDLSRALTGHDLQLGEWRYELEKGRPLEPDQDGIAIVDAPSRWSSEVEGLIEVA